MMEMDEDENEETLELIIISGGRVEQPEAVHPLIGVILGVLSGLWIWWLICSVIVYYW